MSVNAISNFIVTRKLRSISFLFAVYLYDFANVTEKVEENNYWMWKDVNCLNTYRICFLSVKRNSILEYNPCL